jgi:signal transduction histidine kinase
MSKLRSLPLNASPSPFGALTSTSVGWRWSISIIAIGILPILLCASLFALNPCQPLDDLYHSSWDARNGLNGTVTTLAQTTDGFLWVGTTDGLYRFDGISFERYGAQRGQLPSNFVSALLSVRVLHRVRLRQIANAASARFDERLAERTRIARELHDAFLQTVQGSKLVADHALKRSSDPVQMRRALEQLSEWLARAIQEGRAALNSLRTLTTQRNDLADALQRATDNGFVPGSMAVKFSVLGDAREMHPVVRDEVYRIGYEAIRNACLHSSATQLAIELRYSQKLTLRVSDNGIGIDPAITDKGKDGHFGLQGMRERADRVGGKLTLVTSTSGTEIKLVVPGGIIFRTSSSLRQALFAKISNLFRLKGEDSNLD